MRADFGLKSDLCAPSQSCSRPALHLPVAATSSLGRTEELTGWCWDVRTDKWEYGFLRLMEFSEREGHCWPPLNYKTDDGYSLGRWVHSQRRWKERLAPEPCCRDALAPVATTLIVGDNFWALFLGALFTGLRQADLRKLPWSSYDGAAITWRITKRRKGDAGVKVTIPCTTALRLLNSLPRRGPLIFTTATGRAWQAVCFTPVRNCQSKGGRSAARSRRASFP